MPSFAKAFSSNSTLSPLASRKPTESSVSDPHHLLEHGVATVMSKLIWSILLMWLSTWNVTSCSPCKYDEVSTQIMTSMAIARMTVTKPPRDERRTYVGWVWGQS